MDEATNALGGNYLKAVCAPYGQPEDATVSVQLLPPMQAISGHAKETTLVLAIAPQL